MSQYGNYKFTFNFDGMPDSHGDVFMKGCFTNTFGKKENKLYKCFDVTDAVIVDEIKHGTIEYWQSEYTRLTSLMNDLKALPDLNSQDAKDIQLNVKALMQKLKNYELTKSK